MSALTGLAPGVVCGLTWGRAHSTVPADVCVMDKNVPIDHGRGKLSNLIEETSRAAKFA